MLKKGTKVYVSKVDRTGEIFTDLGGGDFIVKFKDGSRLAVNKRNLSEVHVDLGEGKDKTVIVRKPSASGSGDEGIEFGDAKLSIDDLEAMQVPTLIETAKSMGIDVPDTIAKSELVMTIFETIQVAAEKVAEKQAEEKRIEEEAEAFVKALEELDDEGLISLAEEQGIDDVVPADLEGEARAALIGRIIVKMDEKKKVEEDGEPNKEEEETKSE